MRKLSIAVILIICVAFMVWYWGASEGLPEQIQAVATEQAAERD